jgi:glyoxalase family protein
LTASFLTDVLKFERIGEDNGWTRFGFRDAPGVIDLRETPNLGRGAWGVGAVHHLAWRVDDDQHQLAMRAKVEDAGRRPTPVIDRFWFKSVYFLEPGGVLFEMATDGPGFAVDEDPAHLGERLVLPPFLEGRRAEIERVVPPLALPVPAARQEAR